MQADWLILSGKQTSWENLLSELSTLLVTRRIPCVTDYQLIEPEVAAGSSLQQLTEPEVASALASHQLTAKDFISSVGD
jgi:hypothetical protein